VKSIGIWKKIHRNFYKNERRTKFVKIKKKIDFIFYIGLLGARTTN
jgi:hypothetical protein